MSILESMRSGSDSTFMQVVMALLIFAFVGLYINPSGDKAGVVATVNGDAILDTEFSRFYRNALRATEERSQRTLSDAEQKQLYEQVRQSVIERHVLLQEAYDLGIEVSDSEVARQLLSIPFLRNEAGKFDQELYAKWLKRQQRTKADFEETIRDDLTLMKLESLVHIGASTSEPAIREAWNEAGTKVDIQMVRIRPNNFEKDLVVSDEERATWISENEAMIQEAYDRDKARLYDHPEQIRLRMIRLAIRPGGPDEGELVPKLNKLRDRIMAGEDMADLAKRWSEDPSVHQGGDLGLRPVQQLSSEMASAVSGLEAGQLTQVMTSPGDVRLIRVEERIAPKVDELAEVRDAIADRLIRDEKLPSMAARFAEDELLPKWKENPTTPPDELLNAHGLTVTNTGPVPLGGDRNPFGPPQPVLDAARGAAVGEVLPQVYEAGGTLYVARLVSRDEPDEAAFEADKDQIREQFLMARRGAFYRDWVADVKSQATIQ
ncbi:MAG: SurA N-terminal domain-containing protein [Alphaproteobacteria bacterium]|nr:SurA N-terminal domain-containing protein [Alphaproteobacteria bacterium]MCB9697864.1 SurA N-terminal domain-containing protein [Alphaproteobacteria bacterium]